MADYEKSCSETKINIPSVERSITTEEPVAKQRLFCTIDNVVRFVLPFCSAVPDRPNPGTPVTATTCIVDISGLSLWQAWKLKPHVQVASELGSTHYPELLGRTYVSVLLLHDDCSLSIWAHTYGTFRLSGHRHSSLQFGLG
jgi:hypothetical protein